MNRQNMLTIFLALTFLAWVAVLVQLGLLALQRNPQEVVPTPVVVGPQTLATPTPIGIPSSTPILPPTSTPILPPTQTPFPTPIPPLVSHAGTVIEDRLALDFDLSAIRPEMVKEKLFEPVVGRPPSTTFRYCPSPYNWQSPEPGLCYDAAGKIFFLAGFQPNETVYVIGYVNGVFSGIAELRLDDAGRGTLTGVHPLTDVFVLRQNGAYVSSDPALGSPYIV